MDKVINLLIFLKSIKIEFLIWKDCEDAGYWEVCVACD
jgi:hypothetical protein